MWQSPSNVVGKYRLNSDVEHHVGGSKGFKPVTAPLPSTREAMRQSGRTANLEKTTAYCRNLSTLSGGRRFSCTRTCLWPLRSAVLATCPIRGSLMRRDGSHDVNHQVRLEQSSSAIR